MIAPKAAPTSEGGSISMPKLRFPPRSPALALAAIALVAAASGSAVASSLVTSKQIENGTIKLRDLSPATRKALTRAPDAFSAGNGSSPSSTTPLKESVPAGRYFVVAKAVLHHVQANFLTRCDLTGGTGQDIAFGSLGPLGSAHSQETLVSTMVTRLRAPGQLTWSCNAAGGDVSQATINAIEVAAIH
jgi:hypothetical protein